MKRAEPMTLEILLRIFVILDFSNRKILYIGIYFYLHFSYVPESLI